MFDWKERKKVMAENVVKWVLDVRRLGQEVIGLLPETCYGVEVKNGEHKKVEPGVGKILHLSQACLGEVKKEKGKEAVCLFVKFGDKKLALGTLSSEKYPQISFDLVFEKEFELSHNGKSGTVFFTGYKAISRDQAESDDSEYDSEDDDIAAPLPDNNGKPQTETKNATKADIDSAKQKVKIVEPEKEENEDESDDSEEDSGEDELMMNGAGESSDNDDDESDEDDDESMEDDEDETPKKNAEASKRPLESAKKTPVPEKKAKLVTPQKTDGKKVSTHVATPHPSKQVGKTPATNKDQGKQQTPKSEFSCQPCNRYFKTQDALQSHNKAKHTAAK